LQVRQALDNAAPGAVTEGPVGGGTGMICHEFKGGIGTASRQLPAQQGGWTVGALVQANHGQRQELRIDGYPVGRQLGHLPSPSPNAGYAGHGLDRRGDRHRCAAVAAPVPAPGATGVHRDCPHRWRYRGLQRRYLPGVLHR
jgi:L-aminopeptidase/D-esterase-like protein